MITTDNSERTGMKKIQVYLPTNKLKVAEAIAKRDSKHVGTVNREIWEEGLSHYLTKVKIISDFEDQLPDEENLSSTN